MIDLMKKELQPARDILGGNGPSLTPLQIRETLDSIVHTLELLQTALEAFAQEQARVVQLPASASMLDPLPGLTPNPNSPPPTELNPNPLPVNLPNTPLLPASPPPGPD